MNPNMQAAIAALMRQQPGATQRPYMTGTAVTPGAMPAMPPQQNTAAGAMGQAPMPATGLLALGQSRMRGVG